MKISSSVLNFNSPRPVSSGEISAIDKISGNLDAKESAIRAAHEILNEYASAILSKAGINQIASPGDPTRINAITPNFNGGAAQISAGSGTQRYFGGAKDHLYYMSETHKLKYKDKGFDAAREIFAQDTKILNMTDYARSKWLKTEFGEVELFLDIFGDGDKAGVGAITDKTALFNLDSNKDGVLNGADEFFTKLKARGFDKNGDEYVMNLSDLVSEINLRKFIKKDVVNYNQKEIDAHNERVKITKQGEYYDTKTIDQRVSYYASNPNTLLAPSERYQRLSDERLRKFFGAYADKDGWVDLRGKNVFHKDSAFNNFAYLKAGFDGEAHLSEFNPIVTGYENEEPGAEFKYEEHQRRNFFKFYNDYERELALHESNVANIAARLKSSGARDADELIAKLGASKSAYLVAMENEFEKATGLKFSMTNLSRVRSEFEANPARAAARMKDADSIVAMRLNENGTITLKTDGGREFEVSELFSDTGVLNERVKTPPQTPKFKAFAEVLGKNKIENFNADFSGEKNAALKEFGAKSIEDFARRYGISRALAVSNANAAQTAQIYNLRFLEILERLARGGTKFSPKEGEATQIFYAKLDALA